MEFINKAVMENGKKTKGILTIALLCCVACIAVVLGVYSVIKHQYWFVAIYVIAFVLSVVYTVMKINSVIPTFIANDEEYLYMRYWSNGFFPFRTDKGFIGEFIPEKIKSSKIMLDGIAKIYIGTGNFIARALPTSEFAQKMKGYKNQYAATLKRVDFIHLTMHSGKERYMPISEFDEECLAEIIKAVYNANSELYFTTGNRKIRRLVFKENNDARKDMEK